MKITNARVVVTCPGRNFVTLAIETDRGVTAIGDATLNGRKSAAGSYLADHVAPCLIGMDPAPDRGTCGNTSIATPTGGAGPVTMRTIAAVDVALWDIKAKMAGLPLCQLLGGRSRDGVKVYGYAKGAISNRPGQYIDMVYKAIRAQSRMPGVKVACGVGRGKLYYEPADAELPSMTG